MWGKNCNETFLLVTDKTQEKEGGVFSPCMHMLVCVALYVCSIGFLSVCVCMYVNESACACVWVWVCVCMYVSVYVCDNLYVCGCVCSYAMCVCRKAYMDNLVIIFVFFQLSWI